MIFHATDNGIRAYCIGDRIWAFRTKTISENMTEAKLASFKNESQAVESKIVDLLAAMTGDCADAEVVPLTVIISWISAVGDLGR